MKMKPQTFDATLVPSKLVVNEYSHTISKLKPKIRIIHIVAPEIIKTDVQNFREIVQRLTGKAVESKEIRHKGNSSSSQVLSSKPNYGSKPAGMNMEPILCQDTQRMKEEIIEEIYEGENPNAFLSFSGDVDGFIPYMNEFPPRFSQFNTFGEVPFC